MNPERKKVLDMLSEGKISTEDADRLLSKLAGSPDTAAIETTGAARTNGSASLKYLRVVVDSKNGDNVNIRVPLGLFRTGINLATMVPRASSDKLKENGVDLSYLSSLSGDALIEELRELKVDVNSNNGDTVRVFCE